MGVASGLKFLIHASYLEIYNEEVRDLLGKDSKQKLDLKEHPEKGVYVSGNVCTLILFSRSINPFIAILWFLRLCMWIEYQMVS